MVEQDFVGDIKATAVEGSLHYKLIPFFSPPPSTLLQTCFIQLNPSICCEDQSILNALVLQVLYMFSSTSVQLTVPPAFLFINLDLSLISFIYLY